MSEVLATQPAEPSQFWYSLSHMTGALSGALCMLIPAHYYVPLKLILWLYVAAALAAVLLSSSVCARCKPITAKDHLVVAGIWAAFWVLVTIVWIHTGLLLAIFGITPEAC